MIYLVLLGFLIWGVFETIQTKQDRREAEEGRSRRRDAKLYQSASYDIDACRMD